MIEELEQEINLVFNLLDIQKKGYISFQDAVLGVNAICMVIDIEEVTNAINKIMQDTNSDSIDYQCFTSLIQMFYPSNYREIYLQNSFSILDTQKKGYITIDDIRSKIIELNLNINEEDLINMVQYADTDNKGYLLIDEFCNIINTAELYVNKDKKYFEIQ